MRKTLFLIALVFSGLSMGARSWAEDPPMYIGSFGSLGSGPGQFTGAVGVAVNNAGSVFVAETNNDRVQWFTASGSYLGQWGSTGSGDGQFDHPYGLGIDSSDNVFVVDEVNDRVQKFTASGSYLGQWGSSGTGFGEFDGLRYLTVSPADDVYTTEVLNHRVQVFDGNGAFIRAWGTFGSGNGQLWSPNDVVVDGAGNVYVAEVGNRRIQKFDSIGNFLLTWGTMGTGDGQFMEPTGLAVDASNNIYVCDAAQHNIQKFTSTGVFLSRWGDSGSPLSRLNQPRDMEMGPDGTLYVTDTGNSRIVMYRYPAAGEAPDPGLSIVPNVVYSPGGYLGYTAQVNNSLGPMSGVIVEIAFSAQADAMVCWCSSQSHPNMSATTNVSGRAVFLIRAGGCIDPNYVSTPAIQVFAAGLLLADVGGVSPDVVDATGRYPWEGWTGGPPCETGLSDAVQHIAGAIRDRTYNFCTDINSDGKIGLIDAVLLTDPIRQAAVCP